MRTLNIILALLVVSTTWAQAPKTYFFKEIGWTINLPSDFKTLDSIENAKINDRGVKALEESNGITADVTGVKLIRPAPARQLMTFLLINSM